MAPRTHSQRSDNMATAILILTSALVVWFQATGSPLGGWFGVKADLLPSLMIYAGMTVGVRAVVAAGIVGGFLHDALSVSPLGVSILPLCVVGLAAHHWQSYLARDEKTQQFILGALATFGGSVLVLLLLAMTSRGVGLSLWLLPRLLGVTLLGAAMCPLFFVVLDRLNRVLGALPPKYEAQTAAWNFQKFRHKHSPAERVRERAYK
jgi:rod shape-determining protein MreD